MARTIACKKKQQQKTKKKIKTPNTTQHRKLKHQHQQHNILHLIYNWFNCLNFVSVIDGLKCNGQKWFYVSFIKTF